MEMLINGELIDKHNKIKVVNPFNNEIVDTVPSGSLEDMRSALEAANQAKKVISEMSSRKVSRILYDIYEDILNNSNDLANLITLETGKPIKDSVNEIERSVETVLLSAEEAKRIYGETVPLDACIGGKTALGFTVKVPLGVISAITPFNYPVNLAIHKIAPAIAAKNTVVLKPSIKAPLAALKLIHIMARHLPPGVINGVTGHSQIIGDEMILSPFIDKISFTGSIETGISISKKASMKKINLELGGNDPLVVLEDANVDKSVIAAVNGSFLNAGQVCIAVKRIILHEDIADEFVNKLVSKTVKLNMGDPFDIETDVGPLIDEEAAIKVEMLVDDAVNNGAELLLGGKRSGAFYSPTVIDHVKPDMKIVSNETFGPVAPIIRIHEVDEAFEVANNTQYGLQAGVFTESIENALKAAKVIEAGSIIINRQPTFRTDNMPFGGFKMSGMGKEGIKYAVDDMTKTKLVVFG
ncbi:MAG TPA: lactaldehyde dehydrogenase [Methanobacterium sp.]